MRSPVRIAWCAGLFALLAGFDCVAHAAEIHIDPTVRCEIAGVGEMDRNAYINLADHGADFDERVGDIDRYNYLVHELDISFGRHLGPVKGAVSWQKIVREDPSRPGYADLDYLRSRLAKSVKKPSPRMLRDFGELDVACHENHNAFPEFMGQYTTPESAREKKVEYLPQNIDAAVELTAAVLKFGFNDFTRPTYYEPLNEPHWSMFGDEHFLKWHLRTKDMIHKHVPDVLVGGPCMSVSYLYMHGYRTWRGLKNFIDGTDCSMDFYSFHCYDYIRAKEDGTLTGGRITSGLPLTAVFDMVENYTVKTYGKHVPLIVSEHGGYDTKSEEITEFTKDLWPELTGFDREMKVREVANFIAVSTMVANTLNFMDHPHVVKKAVPFILLNSFNWDPRYYASLYAPYNFEDRNRWVETRLIDFYKIFQDFQGYRVRVSNDDPDLQVAAYADGKKLHIIINNLAEVPQSYDLTIPEPAKVRLLRYGRQDDGTPYLVEDKQSNWASLKMPARETVRLTAYYTKPIEPKTIIDEQPCYGDQVGIEVKANEHAEFKIELPSTDGIEYAVLRVGMYREKTESTGLIAAFNGRRITPLPEDTAPRLTDSDGRYATTKFFLLDPKLLRETNKLQLKFPDDTPGHIGSAVIRVGYRKAQER